MTIIVTGASGLLGGPLVDALQGQGRRVVRMVRRPPESDEEAYWEPREDVIDLSVLEPMVATPGDRLAFCRFEPKPGEILDRSAGSMDAGNPLRIPDDGRRRQIDPSVQKGAGDFARVDIDLDLHRRCDGVGR
jgi:nucleoside-diphosphate-sugar epimerase